MGAPFAERARADDRFSGGRSVLYEVARGTSVSRA
jgi:hypothetical protein